jgi:hypothetical protein
MVCVALELLLGDLGEEGTSAFEIGINDVELPIVSFVGVLFAAFASRVTGGVCDEFGRVLSMFLKRLGCDFLLPNVGRFVTSAPPCAAFHVFPLPFSDSALGEFVELPLV